jgi:membrane protease YdiL (CAAX protease family)
MLLPLTGGLLSAWLVVRTDSLGPSIGLHAGWNSGTLAVALLLPVAGG